MVQFEQMRIVRSTVKMNNSEFFGGRETFEIR
jgi:hypothetical protein